MSNVEALRRETAEANVIALLAATDFARLMLASVSTGVWSKPNGNVRQEVREVRQ